MPATLANIAFAKRIFADRVGNDYVYGGCWSPYDTSVGTDCSGLVVHILDAVVNGAAMTWTRHGMTTESWRPIEVGETGPFGTVCVARPSDFPADAVVKIALHHGAGGGVNSHMWCEVDGVRAESNGSDGCVTGDRAMSVYDTGYANDWHYLPPLGARPISVLTVPLTHIAHDRWTSPSPAWAHLIMRESGGDPTIIQQIIDVNSGGNEAEGIFQITPATWRAHGGADFAVSPRLAAPQQQALVAARIFTRNPSGSDWGAGLPGREDPAQLAAGLVPTTTPAPQEEDNMSAEAERKIAELHAALLGREPSRSALRTPGETTTFTVIDLIRNLDGMVHPELVADRASLGDQREIDRLRAVAGNPDPARAYDAELAANIAARAAAEQAHLAAPGGPAAAVIPPPLSGDVAGLRDVVSELRIAVANVRAQVPTPQIQPPTYLPRVGRRLDAVPVDQPAPTTPGQLLGAALDALTALQLSSTLPATIQAPLDALIRVVQNGFPKETP